MEDLLRRYGKGLTATFILLVAFWILVLIVLPNFSMLFESFYPYLSVDDRGGPKDVFSFNN
ncbi:MAG TPA: hypothetical protein PKA03_04725 [Tabrizicola sp.]|nr:hypothetical protein [Tabrizicola sp.]